MSEMAQTYVVPEDENKKMNLQPGKTVEMQTFNTLTNIEPDLTTYDYIAEYVKPEVKPDGDEVGKSKRFTLFEPFIWFKLVCVGDFSGNWCKGVYINDYIKTKPPMKVNRGPDIGAHFYLKYLRRTNALDVKLKIWDIADKQRLFPSMLRIYFMNAAGAMVFWGARSQSLDIALKWRRAITQANDVIPVVLVVDNVSRNGCPVSWLGHGLVMESREAMDEFCIEHGFITWFEMLSRDWVSGENSVFGQAVSVLL